MYKYDFCTSIQQISVEKGLLSHYFLLPSPQVGSHYKEATHGLIFLRLSCV